MVDTHTLTPIKICSMSGIFRNIYTVFPVAFVGCAKGTTLQASEEPLGHRISRLNLVYIFCLAVHRRQSARVKVIDVEVQQIVDKRSITTIFDLVGQ